MHPAYPQPARAADIAADIRNIRGTMDELRIILDALIEVCAQIDNTADMSGVLYGLEDARGSLASVNPRQYALGSLSWGKPWSQS